MPNSAVDTFDPQKWFKKVKPPDGQLRVEEATVSSMLLQTNPLGAHKLVEPAISIVVSAHPGVTAYNLGDKWVERQLVPGDTLLLQPGVPVNIQFDSPIEFLPISFPAGLLHRLVGDDNRTMPEPHSVNDAFLLQCAMTMRDELVGPSPNSKLFQESLLTALILHCINRYGDKRVDAPAAPTGRMDSKKLRAVLAYMRENLASNPSLTELARFARLSPFHFCHLFKHSTGMSPHRWLVNARIEHAKALLKTSQPLRSIALACGFCDQSHLTRAFRRATGMTPAAWRITAT